MDTPPKINRLFFCSPQEAKWLRKEVKRRGMHLSKRKLFPCYPQSHAQVTGMLNYSVCSVSSSDPLPLKDLIRAWRAYI